MTQTAIETRKPSAAATLRDLLEKAKPKLAEVTPKHLSADRLVRIAVASCSKTPQLLQCSPTSVLNSVMQAAQLGLEPGGPLGDAYLVPYKNECTLIVGYRGLVSLARRSGQIISIEAHVVHERDRFVCKYGLDSVLVHEPDWSADPGAVIAVYAVARLRDGGVQYEVMTKAQVEAIRTRSRAGSSGPWVSDWAEMARKTVVRRLCKYLPLSVEMAEALDLDERTETSTVNTAAAALDVGEEVETKTATKAASVLSRLKAQRAAAPVEDVDVQRHPLPQVEDYQDQVEEPTP